MNEHLLNRPSVTRSKLAETVLTIDGKRFSLHDYPFFYGIYDSSSPEILLKTGRQVAKSSCCANLIITDSIVHPHFKTLYISPTKEQTSKFSNTRLAKIIYYSPMIYDNFYDGRGTHNVLLQILKNGSEISLSYADDDPDRIRGISADREFLDEVQDIVYDAVVPVVKECMANSDYGYIVYAGTPKTMDNTIEFLWKHSTQSEWIMKCEGCGSWQFVDSVKSIGMRGLICVKCGHTLNPRSGKWYNFNPMADIKGFHISQPIMPKNNEVYDRWKRILQKMQIYSDTKFKNEVLGVSDAIGSRSINQEDLIALCDMEYFIAMPIPPRVQQGLRTIVAGVDWGGGSDSRGAISRTVLWIFGLTADYKHKTIYFKVFSEENPSANVDAIAEICQQVGVKYIVGDAGGGAIANSRLRDILGPHRVGQSQYGGSMQGTKLIRWSPQANRFLVNRTAVIDSYILALKNHEVIYPNVRQMAIPIQDVLNIYEDRVNSGLTERRIWTHPPTAPDDCLHAQVYAWLAMKIVRGEVEFFYEMRDTEWEVA